MSRALSTAPLGILGMAACFLLGPSARAVEPTPQTIEFFEKNVRPVLTTYCFPCHGSTSKRKANLVLDHRSGVLKGGDSGPAIIPGNPQKSLLAQVIAYAGDIKMPPKGKLPDNAIRDLTRWIELGAPWPEEASNDSKSSSPPPFDLAKRANHWSLQKLTAAPPPQIRKTSWPRDPVDQFVLAKLESKGLMPAAPAEKRVWLRRVTFDLIGLPPTPTELADFLADDSSTAWAKVVDRLLASPHYGERWTRHWLDLVRYAESQGHEFDFEIPGAFEYRDYVVRAFNADVTYDQFVREQIAGDLLLTPRINSKEGINESLVGTGFWYLGEAVHSPVDVRKDMADRIDNQIDVFGKTFLGLTLGCARCHDHKFDAVPTSDYYGLMGYLESSRCQQAFIDDSEPTRKVIDELRGLRKEMDPLAVSLTYHALLINLESKPGVTQGNSELGFLAELTNADEKQFSVRKEAELRRLRGQETKAKEFNEISIQFDGPARSSLQDWFVTGQAFALSQSGDLELGSAKNAYPVRKALAKGLINSGLVSDRIEGALRSKTFCIEKDYIHYRLAGASTRVNVIIDGYQKIQEPIYGGLTFVIEGQQFHWATTNVSRWKGHQAYIEFLDDGAGHGALDQIVFSDLPSPVDRPNSLVLELLAKPEITSGTRLKEALVDLCRSIVEQWRFGALTRLADHADRLAILNGLLEGAGESISTISAKLPELEWAKWKKLREEYSATENRLPARRRAPAILDGTGLDEHIFIRGSPKSLGALVPRHYLQVFSGLNTPTKAAGSGRLDLANKLLSQSQSLVARVIVNRIWQHHFGEGLVASPDDFGVQGQTPSNPELLDYLAAQFVENGWSFKKMHRRLVLSSTYRMSSHADQAAVEADPQNKFLHHMPVQRLEAECIRDAMLQVSGRLDRKIGGPSVPPYITDFMLGRGRPASGPLDGDGRRSLYIKVRRNFLTPFFLAFDYPIPFSTMGRRSVSNVPAQALALMNNPLVVQLAGIWAKQVASQKDLDAGSRIKNMYLKAFSREPTPVEMAEAQKFLMRQLEEYGPDGELKAWADFAQVLFNAKEFIFVE